MKAQIIRCDGTEEVHDVPTFDAIEVLIGAGGKGLDHVNLRHGRTMFVDGSGYDTETVSEDRGGVAYVQLKPVRANKPVNPKATALYHATCKPGTTHQIVGDVAIVTDADFADSPV
jgi:hypothetical protein